MSKRMNRRDFLKVVTVGTAGTALAACSPKVEKVVETVVVEKPAEKVIQTVVVEKEGEKIIQTVVVEQPAEKVIETVVKEVTPTPEPVVQEQVADVFGGLPRRQTFVADILTGRVGTPDDFNEMIGWHNRDRGTQQLAFEPLWSIDFASGKIIAGSADGDPVYNDDFTECTIKLRQGINWDDGEPFTSADVVNTVETFMKFDKLSAYSFFTENVDSVTAPDDYTVVFRLKISNSRFHTTFLDRWGCTYIMPKHIFEKVEDPTTFKWNPVVGTGPYKLHSFDPNGEWTIWEKRTDWQKSPTGILFGEPVPQYIVFEHFANEGAKILAQLTHECDVLNLSSEGLKALLAQSKTSRAYQPTYPWVVNNDPCITGICYNTYRAPFDNVDVRWALTLAIDFPEYVGIAVDGSSPMSPVHIPHLSNYPQDFIEPMQDWLKALTIDVGNGEQFAVYDPTVPERVVAYAKSRGYTFPEDPASIEKAFGLGWYKYAPDAATKLLEKNGFTQKDGKWMLPDGTPWKIAFMTGTDMTHPGYLNAVAAVQEWKKFGIDAEMYSTESATDLIAVGDYDVSSTWPAREPWGAGPDLYRVLNPYSSTYVKPLGERTQGHESRWSSDTMDAIIKELRETDPTDYAATVAVGIKGLKEAVLQMPGTPTFGYIGFVGWDQKYWTNWPGSENPYTQPYTHWGPFKFMTPFLQTTGA